MYHIVGYCDGRGGLFPCVPDGHVTTGVVTMAKASPVIPALSSRLMAASNCAASLGVSLAAAAASSGRKEQVERQMAEKSQRPGRDAESRLSNRLQLSCLATAVCKILPEVNRVDQSLPLKALLKTHTQKWEKNKFVFAVLLNTK